MCSSWSSSKRWWSRTSWRSAAHERGRTTFPHSKCQTCAQKVTLLTLLYLLMCIYLFISRHERQPSPSHEHGADFFLFFGDELCTKPPFKSLFTSSRSPSRRVLDRDPFWAGSWTQELKHYPLPWFPSDETNRAPIAADFTHSRCHALRMRRALCASF